MTGMQKASRPARAPHPRRRSRSTRAAARALVRPSLAMVLLLSGLLLASAFGAIEIQRNALAKDAAAFRREIASADAYNRQLAADVASKKTDDYVVNKARDYGYVLPGEALIGVQHDAAPATVIASPPSVSRVQKWLALFFGAR